MLPSDILNALSNGGISLMLFVMVWFLWRELIRSRKECEARLDHLSTQQIVNVTKIATLNGQIEMLTRATFERSFHQTSSQQPPTN